MLAQTKPNQNKDKADIAPWNITDLGFITIKILSSCFPHTFWGGDRDGRGGGMEAQQVAGGGGEGNKAGARELLRNRTAEI